MVERPERKRHEAEGFAGVERDHVAVDEPRARLHVGRLLPQLLVAAIKHVLGEVQPDDSVAGGGDGQKNPTGPAAELQDAAIRCASEVEIEIHVGPRRVVNGVVVELRDERVSLVPAGLAQWIPLTFLVMLGFTRLSTRLL